MNSKKIPAEMNIGSQIPPINCSIFEVMNHLKTYSSRTELMNTQNSIASVNFQATVKPTESNIFVSSSGFNILSPRIK